MKLIMDERLERMRDLKRGWNGYGADPPSELASQMADRMLTMFSTGGQLVYRVAPSAVGGVGITWRDGRRKCYVECFNDGTVYQLLSDGLTEAVSVPVEMSDAAFRQVVQDGIEWVRGEQRA